MQLGDSQALSSFVVHHLRFDHFFPSLHDTVSLAQSLFMHEHFPCHKVTSEKRFQTSSRLSSLGHVPQTRSLAATSSDFRHWRTPYRSHAKHPGPSLYFICPMPAPPPLQKLAVSNHEDTLLNKGNRASIGSIAKKPSIPLNKSTSLYLLSAVLLCLCFLLSFFLRLDSNQTGTETSIVQSILDPFGDSVYRQEAYYDQLEPGVQCKPKSVFSSELFTTPALTNMDLEKEAKRMAAEFAYPKDVLNKGVKQFIEEMREGLGKQGAQMSQIPTYVTSVPNGTEKVVFTYLCSAPTLTHIDRVLSWPSTSAAPTSAFVPLPCMEIIHSP